MFCTDENLIFAISCTKSNGQCQKVHPQYIGESGKNGDVPGNLPPSPTRASWTPPSPWGYISDFPANPIVISVSQPLRRSTTKILLFAKCNNPTT